ncbi:MAG: 50S ribosomal protein L25/general stress protein Ctc [Desulfobacterales bacterium]|nr:MAG: 50S ribosomal protein L25/general stress protein Ctc [Desulfobacterales bacterium]
MELIDLKANIRKSTGNGPARRLRRSGQIPAVLYGPETESILLSVNASEFEKVLKISISGQVLLNLIIQNGETFTRSAMVKELQTHPVSRDFLHIDFYEIAMDRKIRVKVPVVTTGKSKGVELGGILQLVRRELEILCLPLKVPESIEIDVSDLDVGDAVHIGEIALAGDMEFLDDDHFTVVTVLTPKIEEVEEEEVEELEEGEEAEEPVDKEKETPGVDGEE